LDGSAPFEIIGPKGSIKKEQGLIIAKRHIHFSTADAERFGVTDKQVVSLKVGGERGAIFLNVVCRVNPSYALECHIDFDEGNAVGVGNGTLGEIVQI
jgi:putative phosphotransacetylase